MRHAGEMAETTPRRNAIASKQVPTDPAIDYIATDSLIRTPAFSTITTLCRPTQTRSALCVNLKCQRTWRLMARTSTRILAGLLRFQATTTTSSSRELPRLWQNAHSRMHHDGPQPVQNLQLACCHRWLGHQDCWHRHAAGWARWHCASQWSGHS